MGLGQVLSGRNCAGEGYRRTDGVEDAILGRDRSSLRLRLYRRDLFERASGIWMDERNSARHAVASLDNFCQQYEELSKKTARWIPHRAVNHRRYRVLSCAAISPPGVPRYRITSMAKMASSSNKVANRSHFRRASILT